ncbi:iron ABC transporter permease [soil metagenome]
MTSTRDVPPSTRSPDRSDGGVEQGADRPFTPGLPVARLSWRWWLAGWGCLIAAVLLGVMIGPAGLAPSTILRALIDGLPGVSLDTGLTERQAAVLWQIRMPRVVLGALVGGALSLSGAAYQGTFRNPLADPYLLGVAAGAGLGATVAIAYFGGSTTLLLPLAAFGGALVGVAATYTLGRSIGGRSGATIILSGVAVASFLTAIQTFVQQRNDDTLRDVYAWILGRLGTAGWGEVLLILPHLIVAGIVILLHRRLLDVLAVGEAEADTLGVNAGRVRLTVVLAATLATAAAVAVSGLIGFVGIIVPHTIRLLAGASYRVILPLSVLLGGAFLVLADVLARTLLSPAELPIGVVTAFFGAPFFFVVLRTTRRSL